MTRRVKRGAHVMSEEDFEKLIEEVDKFQSYFKTPEGSLCKARDKAIFQFLYYTGLRPAECLMLKWSDLDIDKRIIQVRPYTNKERNSTPASLTEMALKCLMDYKKVYQEIGLNTDYIFPSFKTLRPLTTSAMGKRFQRYAQACGISSLEYHDSKGHPFYTLSLYSFRHTFGSKIYERYHDSEAVTIALRHTNPSSAHAYIHLSHKQKSKIANSIFEPEVSSEELESAKRKLKNAIPDKTMIVNNTINYNFNQFIVQQQETNKLLSQAVALLTKKIIEN